MPSYSTIGSRASVREQTNVDERRKILRIVMLRCTKRDNVAGTVRAAECQWFFLFFNIIVFEEALSSRTFS